MYYVVFENTDTKIHRFVAFSDKEQFEEDYRPEHGEVIAKGIPKSEVDKLCPK